MFFDGHTLLIRVLALLSVDGMRGSGAGYARGSINERSV